MKTPFAYPVLVGVPLLGMLGILRLGDDLVAPRSIGGEWDLSIAASPDAAPGGGCAWSAFGDQPRSFLISQSGTKAVVHVGDPAGTELSVTIEGDVIAGSNVGGAGEISETAGTGDECRTGPLTLEARLTEEPGAARIEGSFARTGCGECAPARFVASRRRAGEPEP